jgi:hypothetical protein
MEREQKPIIRHTKPPNYNVDQLVTLAGHSFVFRVSLCDGGIRTEFNSDTSSLKKRIGRKNRPGGPPVKPM